MYLEFQIKPINDKKILIGHPHVDKHSHKKMQGRQTDKIAFL